MVEVVDINTRFERRTGQAYSNTSRLVKFLREGPNRKTTHARKAKIWSRYNHLLRKNHKQANLQKAEIGPADLRTMDFRGTNFYQANLYGANLKRANLNGAYMAHANLMNANLREARLIGTNLMYTSLYNTNMRNSILYETNLLGADLYKTDLRGAIHLSKTRGLGIANLRDTKFSETDREFVEKTNPSPTFE